MKLLNLLKLANTKYLITNNNVGFTLIEILIVISVLALLTTAGIVILNPAEQYNKSLDTKRKKDLAQVQRAIEIYYQDFGRYPYASNGRICTTETVDSCINWGGDWRPYIDVLPLDPKASKNYAYWTDATGQSYAIFASLERGAKDPQACNAGNPCFRSGDGVTNLSCGGTCNYGVSSPNISP